MRRNKGYTSRRLKQKNKSGFAASVRTNLIAGFFTLLPLGLSLFVLFFLLKYLEPIAEQIISWSSGKVPAFFSSYPFVYMVLILALLAATVGIGVISKWVIGKQLIHIGDFVFGRIPIVGWFYETVKQVVAAFNTGKSAFKAVVLIPYPHDRVWALAFLTNDDPEQFDKCVGEDLVAVFMPTTPNPTSGFLMYVPRKDVKTTNLSVDQAFKLIISTGMLSLEEIKEGIDPCKDDFEPK